MLDTINAGYTVLLNEDKAETAFIRKEGRRNCASLNSYYEAEHTSPYSGEAPTPYFVFETWETYLKWVAFIQAVYPDVLTLYDEPNGNIITGQGTKKNYSYRIIALKDNWAQVVPLEQYYNSPDPEKLAPAGWVKWHDGQKLLIAITERTME